MKQNTKINGMILSDRAALRLLIEETLVDAIASDRFQDFIYPKDKAFVVLVGLERAGLIIKRA